MRILSLTFVSILCIAGNVADNGSLNSSRLLDLLYSLCPGADVCAENRTLPMPSRSFSPGFGPCCTECSCSEDCMDKNICCFPDKQLASEKTRSSCLYPTTVQPLPDQRHIYQSYYMITSVHKTMSSGEPIDVVCGDEKVAPWGSLFPVYSAKRKQIYKNRVCAEADSVDDGKHWDAIITCDRIDQPFPVDVSFNILGLESDFMQENCRVNFMFPGNKEEIKPHICFVDLIDTCSTTDFEIPDGIDASRSEVITACKSGLISPYYEYASYANVFCQMCNAFRVRVDSVCFLPYAPSFRSFAAGFTALLDFSFIVEDRAKYDVEKTLYPIACRLKGMNSLQDCRRIFCPSGQLRDATSECKYPSQPWYHQTYSVTINITAELYIDVYELFKIEPGRISTALPKLVSPWPDVWSIDSISYENNTDYKNITKLLVILKNKIPSVMPDVLIENIKKLASRKWFVLYKKIKIALRSRLAKVRYDLIKTEFQISNGGDTQNITFPVYIVVYNSITIYEEKHYITKLYMCDQIELARAEFSLSEENTLLLNRISNQVLLDGEFSIVMSHIYNETKARVCLDNSGFYQVPNNTGVMFISSMFVIRHTVVVLLLLVSTNCAVVS